MRERPILFSGPMVRAILDGRKTQTRRFCSTHLPGAPKSFAPYDYENSKGKTVFGFNGGEEYLEFICKFGRVEDRLWVRESFGFAPSMNSVKPSKVYRQRVFYKEDDKPTDGWIDLYPDKWRPSIFMPRWASRITLEITGVRVERLQDITVEDIIAEGLSTTLREHDACCHLNEQWIDLWDSINADRAPWDSNPWVWVIEFKTI